MVQTAIEQAPATASDGTALHSGLERALSAQTVQAVKQKPTILYNSGVEQEASSFCPEQNLNELHELFATAKSVVIEATCLILLVGTAFRLIKREWPWK